MSESDESTVEVCQACDEPATHEVQPPNPDRDDWIPVCESHADELRPISASVRRRGDSSE